MKSIVKKSSSKESKTVFWMPPQSSGISENSSQKVTLKHIREWLTSLQPASHANRFQTQGKGKVVKIKEICGRQQSSVFAKYDRNLSSWKTLQASLLTNTLEDYTDKWPSVGIMLNGQCWELPILEQSTIGKGSDFWHTPKVSDSVKREMSVNSRGEPTLSGQVRLFPKGNLPNIQQQKIKAKSWKKKDIGFLSPMWVDWLMGFPIGWTDLKPLQMHKFLKWFKKFS